MLWTWAGFIVSLVTILIVSKRNLPLGLIGGAIILGVFTLPFSSVLNQISKTLSDPTVLIIAAAMGIIPLLGGVMKESGEIDLLINNVRLPKRTLLPFSASIMGLLPMPGGALLSAPIVDKAGGKGVDGELKGFINVWFRHLFILIYPLEPALIVATKMSNLDLYVAMLYLFPVVILAAILGYIFFLRKVNGRPNFIGRFSAIDLSIPLVIITIAPITDFLLKRLLGIGAVSTLIGVSTALLLAILLRRRSFDMKKIVFKMRPWNFSLIIIGMFLYQHIFMQTNAGTAISQLPLPILTLSMCGGFLLGFFTGRVQLPASIVIPIYLASGDIITPGIFALLYSSVYFGYIMSPAHPCLVVTCEYFKMPVRLMVGRLAGPATVVFGVVLGLSYLF
ncbi:MAG: DUF401 family protein [candidate division Zixibacteria bacterium]|nr:DUF401 family protein [candidate division Zixibacteria bacterium]